MPDIAYEEAFKAESASFMALIDARFDVEAAIRRGDDTYAAWCAYDVAAAKHELAGKVASLAYANRGPVAPETPKVPADFGGRA